MKNGTASSGNDSTPAIMRWATTTSGTLPDHSTKNSEAPAIETATGTPKIINNKKVPIKIPILAPRRARRVSPGSGRRRGSPARNTPGASSAR
ncbi:hypothetical protein BPNSA17_06850 [Bordetella petrii]